MIVNWSNIYSPYTEQMVRATAPTAEGVYLLWVKLKNKDWRCFYVGQAMNIQKRLLDHLSSTEENKCIKNNVSKYICGFSFTIITKQSDRDGVEKYLINYFKPECNQMIPAGTAIDV